MKFIDNEEVKNQFEVEVGDLIVLKDHEGNIHRFLVIANGNNIITVDIKTCEIATKYSELDDIIEDGHCWGQGTYRFDVVQIIKKDDLILTKKGEIGSGNETLE